MRGSVFGSLTATAGGASSRHGTPTGPNGPLGPRLRDVGGEAHPRVAGDMVQIDL